MNFSTATPAKVKLSLCQLMVGKDKQQNVQNAIQSIQSAAANGSKIVVLPEVFNSPYGNDYFPEYAEVVDGTNIEKSDTLLQMQKTAKQLGIYLVAGSIPTREGEKLYNTSFTFDPNGRIVAKYQKIHLFDVSIPGGITFQESKTLSPGNKLATFDVNLGEGVEVLKVGVGICFDVRFPELAQLYQQSGCKLLVYPGAFNMTTGPLHWELLCRARAVDNQCYVAMCSPARDEKGSYVAWGHSLIVDAMARKVAEADVGQEIISAELDISQVNQTRNAIPSIKNKRTDLYSTNNCKV